MSIIARDCKVIKKSTGLPEFLNLEFIASNIQADMNLLRVKEALQKKTHLKEELLMIGTYWAQYAIDLSLRDECVVRWTAGHSFTTTSPGRNKDTFLPSWQKEHV